MRLYEFLSNVNLTSKKVKVILTFYAKRGAPHTTSESAQNEVYYCMVPHGFATFHAKRGLPNTIPESTRNKVYIVWFHIGLQLSMRSEVHRTPPLSQRETRSIMVPQGFATFHAKRNLSHTISESVRNLWFLASHGKLWNHTI